MSIHGAIAAEISGFGGLLRCTECGTERALGDVSRRLANGWPKCCGYTMRWLTQRELDAEQFNALIPPCGHGGADPQDAEASPSELSHPTQDRAGGSTGQESNRP